MFENPISLYGRGFIGGRYDEMFPGSQIIARDCVSCIHPKILNFRSTIHNYNPIDGNPYLDIETNLLEFMEMVKRANLCFGKEAEINQISSWFVLGDTDIPANETSYCNPKGFYSITKRASEQLLISYCETFNMKYRILRLANVLGIGDGKISKRKNALQYMVKCIVKGESIVVYEDDVIRDYIWVDDVCRAIHPRFQVQARSGNDHVFHYRFNGFGYTDGDWSMFGKWKKENHLCYGGWWIYDEHTGT